MGLARTPPLQSSSVVRPTHTSVTQDPPLIHSPGPLTSRHGSRSAVPHQLFSAIAPTPSPVPSSLRKRFTNSNNVDDVANLDSSRKRKADDDSVDPGIFSPKPRLARSPTPASTPVKQVRRESSVRVDRRRSTAIQPIPPRHDAVSVIAEEPSPKQSHIRKNGFLANILFEKNDRSKASARHSFPLSQHAPRVTPHPPESTSMFVHSPLSQTPIPKTIGEAMSALGRSRIAETCAKQAHLRETATRVKLEKELGRLKLELVNVQTQSVKSATQISRAKDTVEVKLSEWQEVQEKILIVTELTDTVTRLRHRVRRHVHEAKLQRSHRKWNTLHGIGFEDSEASRERRIKECELNYDIADLKETVNELNFTITEAQHSKQQLRLELKTSQDRCEAALQQLAELRGKTSVERVSLEVDSTLWQDKIVELERIIHQRDEEKEEFEQELKHERKLQQKELSKLTKAGEKKLQVVELENRKLSKDLTKLQDQVVAMKVALEESTKALQVAQENEVDEEEVLSLRKSVRKWQRRGEEWASDRTSLEENLAQIENQLEETRQALDYVKRSQTLRDGTTKSAKSKPSKSVEKDKNRRSESEDDEDDEVRRPKKSKSSQPSVTITNEVDDIPPSVTAPKSRTTERREKSSKAKSRSTRVNVSDDEDETTRRRSKSKVTTKPSKSKSSTTARLESDEQVEETFSDTLPVLSRILKDQTNKTSSSSSSLRKTVVESSQVPQSKKEEIKKVREVIEESNVSVPVVVAADTKKKRRLFGNKEKVSFQWNVNDVTDLGLPPELSPVKKSASASHLAAGGGSFLRAGSVFGRA